MSSLVFYLTFGVCIASIAADGCAIKSYTPATPFRFAQQIFWDDRTDSIFFADVSAATGSDYIYRFDWNSRKLYSASLTDSLRPVSFVVPAESSTNLLIAGQGHSVLRIQWDGISRQAKLLNVVATLCSDENKGYIDRGGSSPDGTLFMSIIPPTYCNKTGTDHPKSSFVYLNLEGRDTSIKSALRPATYTNGIYFDSKTDTCYVADDCSATVFATEWNRKTNTLANLRPVFKFDRETARTDFPAGLTVDQCSNFYVGDHNSGLIYYVNSQTGDVIRKYKVPGTHITSVGFVGKDLDHLCVLTGTEYHDSYGGSMSKLSNPGNGKMYLIPITKECCNDGCKGKPGVPVCGI